jgi:plastocyanin
LDPEQIYQEVLQEEQQKGSSSAVAEGRAKAARVRAQHGSPHPKEPKWWPGAQPHLEGGAEEAEAPAEAPAEEPAEAPAEEPAEAPAEEPAEAPAEEPAVAEAPAAEAPGEAPAEAPAEEPAAAPAAPGEPAAAPQPAAAAAEPAPAAAEQGAPQPAAQPAAPAAAPAAVPETQTVGVRHGTATGTRLRPEDAVATEAQFEGERAMAARRKLIDDLVATGVPAVTAARTGRERVSPMAPLVYLVIVVLAVALIVNQAPNIGGAEESSAGEAGGGVATDTITAQSTAFNASEIRLPADQETEFTLVNEDTVQHNIAIYESPDEASGEKLFDGDLVDGGSEETYTFPPLKEGEHFFNCEVHPTAMTGTVTVEAAQPARGGKKSPSGKESPAAKESPPGE